MGTPWKLLVVFFELAFLFGKHLAFRFERSKHGKPLCLQNVPVFPRVIAETDVKAKIAVHVVKTVAMSLFIEHLPDDAVDNRTDSELFQVDFVQPLQTAEMSSQHGHAQKDLGHVGGGFGDGRDFGLRDVFDRGGFDSGFVHCNSFREIE